MSTWDERAAMLDTKAAEDEYTLRMLNADADAPDAPLGFHAQQAVEKLMKAVLCKRRVPFPKTHDLAHLVKLLEDYGIDHPAVLAESIWLTAYAADLRYESAHFDPEDLNPLDRPATLALVEAVREWATPLLDAE